MGAISAEGILQRLRKINAHAAEVSIMHADMSITPHTMSRSRTNYAARLLYTQCRPPDMP